MKKIMILAAVAATLAACSNDDEAFVDNRDPNVIYISAGVEGVSSTVTRTVEASTFPNYNSGAKIAVVAKYQTLATDWTTPYIDHQSASVQGGDTYNFTWTTTQYWPVGGETLQFIAYSPVAGDSNNTIALDATNREKLIIALPTTDTDMPDIIVANKNPKEGTTTDEEVDITGHKDNSNPDDPAAGVQKPVTISFPFKHILSELNVVVKGKDITATNEAVVTKVEVIVDKEAVKKTFDMTKNVNAGETEGWTVDSTPSADITYTYNNGGSGWNLASSSSATINGNRPILLFPDTQAKITVRVYVKDSSSDASEIQLPEVVLGSVQGNGTLVQGKITTLNITVEGTEITALAGTVTEWVSAGSYDATIH